MIRNSRPPLAAVPPRDPDPGPAARRVDPAGPGARAPRVAGSGLVLLVAWAGLSALAGCGGWQGGGRTTDIHQSGGATVIMGAELERTSGSLLRAMVGKVPNMKVNFTGLARCPAIAMRHYEDIRGVNFPDVYVDGTRANNTCILESLQAQDAERVEVYPMGFTRRPGYGTSTHGLILVFLRSS